MINQSILNLQAENILLMPFPCSSKRNKKSPIKNNGQLPQPNGYQSENYQYSSKVNPPQPGYSSNHYYSSGVSQPSKESSSCFPDKNKNAKGAVYTSPRVNGYGQTYEQNYKKERSTSSERKRRRHHGKQGKSSSSSKDKNQKKGWFGRKKSHSSSSSSDKKVQKVATGALVGGIVSMQNKKERSSSSSSSQKRRQSKGFKQKFKEMVGSGSSKIRANENYAEAYKIEKVHDQFRDATESNFRTKGISVTGIDIK